MCNDLTKATGYPRSLGIPPVWLKNSSLKCMLPSFKKSLCCNQTKWAVEHLQGIKNGNPRLMRIAPTLLCIIFSYRRSCRPKLGRQVHRFTFLCLCNSQNFLFSYDSREQWIHFLRESFICVSSSTLLL